MILMFLIGILIIALGIRVLIQERKEKKKRCYRAVVTNCDESFMDVRSTGRRHYDVTLEIQTDYGVTYKTIKSDRDYGTGYVCQVHYDVQTDTAEFARDYRQNKSKDGWIAIGFGVLWSAIIGLVMWMQQSETGSEIGGRIFGYGISITFVCIGLYALIIKPIKNRKQMGDCQEVPGRIVDFTTRRGSKRNRKLYCPIYGFYYQGMEQTIHGTISSNTDKYRQIGRKVTIVINNKTGQIYCAEDEKTGRNMELLFGAVGMLFLTILLLADFTDVLPADNNNNNNNKSGYSSDEEAGNDYNNQLLDLNSDGYSTQSINMPPDIEYTEYIYMPGEDNVGCNAYGYTIKIYEEGVGEVIIFPVESTGKRLNQFFSFNVLMSDLKLVIKDIQQYDYEEIVGEHNKEVTGDGIMAHEYVYYYDGEERKGSGGYGIDSYVFTSVTNHIKGCVPIKVWNAIEDEIDNYYK